MHLRTSTVSAFRTRSAWIELSAAALCKICAEPPVLAGAPKMLAMPPVLGAASNKPTAVLAAVAPCDE
eukprot:1813918-Amphidinium_carterae.1